MYMLTVFGLGMQVLPKTEMSVMFHVLMHVPDAIWRWNAARNFWGFFGEKCGRAPARMYTLSHTFSHISTRNQLCCVGVGAWGISFATFTTVTWRARTS